MSGLIDFVESYVERLDEVIAEFEDDFRAKAKYDSKLNKAFFDEYMAVFAKVSAGFAQVIKIVADARLATNELRDKAKRFEAVKGSLKEEFAEVARKLSEELKSSGATAIEPDEFLKFRKTIDNAKQLLAALGKEKEQQTILQSQLGTELTKLNERWHEEFRIIKDRLDLINNQETALQI